MNEPPPPPEPTPSSSSDPVPPPPPPPPFTPPPVPPEPPRPPVPPTPPPPKPPIYTPPPGQPGKKSPLPWILGGCGCLILIIIVIAIIALVSYRAKQKVTEFKSDFKSALKSAEENDRRPTTTPPATNRDRETRSPKAGWTTYANVKANLPAALQSNFIPFSFDYPKSFELQPQSESNFVKVEKYAAAGKGNTSENFAVGYAWFNPPNAQSDALYDKLLDQLGQQLSGSFHNYKELKRTAVTVDGVDSRAALFQADFKDSAKTMIYGKTIVVHPPGKKNGVTILMLGTSLSRDVKSADYLGTKGETADILRPFKFL